jgi:WD40 repeat protein
LHQLYEYWSFPNYLFPIKTSYPCQIFLQNGHLAIGDLLLIKIWNVTSGHLVNSLYGHRKNLLALTELRKDYLASSSLDMTIKIWNYKIGTCLSTLRSHKNQILTLTLFQNVYLLSGSFDKTVKVWNLAEIFKDSQKDNVEYGEFHILK